MRAVGELVSVSPLDYLRPLTNPWVILGIVLLASWLVAQLSLLSWADLTYVLPITASAYVLTTLIGAVALHEHVTAGRWTGVGLIFGGILLVSRTRHRTAPMPEDHR